MSDTLDSWVEQLYAVWKPAPGVSVQESPEQRAINTKRRTIETEIARLRAKKYKRNSYVVTCGNIEGISTSRRIDQINERRKEAMIRTLETELSLYR